MKLFGKDISKKIIIFIMICFFVVGCGKTETPKQDEKESIILNDNLEFEINSELSLLSLVSEDNKVEIVSDDEIVDTSILGDKEITIKYLVNGKEEEKTFTITITDTQAPTIKFTKELSTTSGTKINLLKGVKVSDNSNEEINATIEGDYDFNKEGTYKLKYVAVDSSGNKKEEEFTLKVNKKTTTSSSSSNATTKAQAEANVKKYCVCNVNTDSCANGWAMPGSIGDATRDKQCSNAVKQLEQFGVDYYMDFINTPPSN